MSTHTLKLIETDSRLLETCANKVQCGGEWYYMPFWFKKVGDGMYDMYQFDDLPNAVKNLINESRNHSTL